MTDPDLQMTAQLSRELHRSASDTEPAGNVSEGQEQRVQGNGSHHLTGGPPASYDAPHIQPQMQSQGPHSQLAQMTDQYGMQDERPTKRTKVSRACDECRRKKIRCDAVGDENAEGTQCTSCKRSSMICQFSRVPMKRGPSKGYVV